MNAQPQPAVQQSPDSRIVERIQKLLNLAAKNPNEAEAASATAKAQELLAQYNLDASVIENATGVKDGRREQAAVEGGFYKHQRDLWKALSELNFCIHWMQGYQVKDRVPRKQWDGSWKTEERFVWRKRHVLVGRIVNTTTTKHMAAYLESVIERIVRDKIHGTEVARLSNWATSFRKGVADRIVEKIEERRSEVLKEEARKAAVEKRNAEHAASRAGVSTARTLTITDHIQAEHDANVDFIYGDGTSARWASERAEAAAERKREREEYTKWAKENPEEARKQEEEARKGRRSSGGSRWRGGPRETRDMSAYYSGYDAAANVSIDQQVDKAASKVARIGRG